MNRSDSNSPDGQGTRGMLSRLLLMIGFGASLLAYLVALERSDWLMLPKGAQPRPPAAQAG